MEGIEIRINVSPDVAKEHGLEGTRREMAREFQKQAGWVLAELFRESMSTAGGEAVDSAEFDPRRDRKVSRGKDGFLFLDNDNNQVMAQHAGLVRFTEAQLEHWRLLLENRIAWLARRSGRYYFLVAPNAHSVYTDKLPEHVSSAEQRPVHALIDHLNERSYARLVYPVEELRRERDRSVYPRTSSYWSDLGAFIAYRVLIAEIRRELPGRVLELGDFEQSEEIRPGDLGNKLDPVERSPVVRLRLREPRARLAFDNGIRNNGRRVEFEGDPDDRRSCLVFGDSFTAPILPFLAESFGRLVFAHLPTFDHTLVERERPDVVVTLLNERFLIRPPIDVPSRTLEQHEAEKRARLAEAEKRRV